MAGKEEIRRSIWDRLEREDIADFPRPCYGRIPNFKGSQQVPLWLLRVPEFKSARCVFCPPDFVLKSVRDLVLREGKILAAALPHMRGFVELRGEADTSIRGLARYGRPLKTPVDFIVQGSVAVDPYGNRLGKGTGYGDQEIAYLKGRGLLREGCKVATLVHDVQVVEDLSPFMEPHDVRVDYVLTPTRWFITTPGAGKVHEVKVHKTWEEEIVAGRKRVEGRLWRGRFRQILRGDRLKLGSVEAMVRAVVWYPSFEAMLRGEGLEAVIPGARSLEEALRVYREIYSEAEEKRYGVVAFRLYL
ncbi:MAG: 5-formyltetrahydrofolate cyclo-ligase [Anaerolineae bacterium]|nr:5-formyltetrahydrofolate cyclo-ligase [Anaerolineae bacterium]